MLRTFIAAISLTLLGTPLFALCGGESYLERLSPDQYQQLQQDAAAIRYGKGTAWTATKGSKVITLVGTMHINDARLTATMRPLITVIQTAELILLEATPAEEAALEAEMMKHPEIFMNATGPTLPEVLPEETWNALTEALRARQIPAFLAAKFQPWYLMMTLSIPPCAMGDILAKKRGLDHMIMDEATASGIPMQALEPFDTLFDIMQSDTAEEQIEMLTLSVGMDIDQQSMFVAMLDSYFDGEVGRLIAMSRLISQNLPNMDPAEGLALTLEAEQKLIIDRNLAWMPVIGAAVAAHDNIMIAVGAAHLPDENGLVALLAADGWAITPF